MVSVMPNSAIIKTQRKGSSGTMKEAAVPMSSAPAHNVTTNPPESPAGKLTVTTLT